MSLLIFFIKLRKFFSIAVLLKIFITNEYWILSNADLYLLILSYDSSFQWVDMMHYISWISPTMSYCINDFYTLLALFSSSCFTVSGLHLRL